MFHEPSFKLRVGNGFVETRIFLGRKGKSYTCGKDSGFTNGFTVAIEPKTCIIFIF